MEDLASLWGYQESVDELKQKLHSTTLELEQLKMERGEEMRRNEEYVKQLMQMVKMSCQERDEARDQLQKILNKVISSTNQAELFSGLPHFHPDSPLLKTTKANSSITESNSLSETTYNYHSHGSSPSESFFDTVSSPSPELSNMNMGDSGSIAAFLNQPLVQDSKAALMPNNGAIIPSGIPVIDHTSFVIDNLAKGKTLPQKGKFLKSVLEAGPLLQNLLVAGPLPRWRNPPQLQTLHIPPVSIEGCDAADIMSLKTSAANVSPLASMPLPPLPYTEMSCASSQILATPMLNFAKGPSGACLGSDRLISAGATANSYVSLNKRQRFY